MRPPRLLLSLILLCAALLPVMLLSGTAAAKTGSTPTLLKVAHNTGLNEKILVTAKGFTLYYWTEEKPGTIKCTSDCATAWPPLLLPKGAKLQKSIASATGKLGLITRSDGTKQLTYNRHGLYRYFDDKHPGDTLCQAVGGWYVIAVKTKR